jgi:glycosyltransferase involved in cell wall biosynthesis
MTEFPRLLVATEFPPNGAGGGAAVVRQMLKDWPAEKLFWWSCFPDPNQLFGQKVAAHRVAAIPQKLYPSRRWCGLKSWLLETFWVPRATRHLQRTLETLKPDVVWVIPHALAIPPMMRVLPGAGIGFHVSIHDYMDDRGFGMRFGAVRSRRIAAMAGQLYAAATTRDAIGREMVDDLRARTGRDGLITRAGLEQEDFDYLLREPEPQNDSIRIAYAGTIVAADEFALVATALGQIRRQLLRPVTLELFGNHSYRLQSWFDASWMKEHGSLPALELSRALKKCSWGLSPMRLADDDPRYNRFSLPTKFVSYLAAGLPVIVLGHPESTVVKMAQQYQTGLCVTEGNPEKLGAQLLAALSETNPRSKYRAEIQRCALAEFDARRMRAALYENFQTCASVFSGRVAAGK